MTINDNDRALLEKYATEIAPDRWSFTAGYSHSAETALKIIKACQVLGVRVTDM